MSNTTKRGAIAAIATALAVVTLAGCSSTDDYTAAEPTPTPTVTDSYLREPTVVNGPQCDGPITDHKFDPRKSSLSCPERVKRDKAAKKSWDEFVEKYGYEPGAGTALNPDATWPATGRSYNDSKKRGGSGAKCVWSPPMNYDWHDDYVCGGVRQYFLPNDDFVEPWEIDAAAAEWEARH